MSVTSDDTANEMSLWLAAALIVGWVIGFICGVVVCTDFSKPVPTAVHINTQG